MFIFIHYICIMLVIDCAVRLFRFLSLFVRACVRVWLHLKWFLNSYFFLLFVLRICITKSIFLPLSLRHTLVSKETKNCVNYPNDKTIPKQFLKKKRKEIKSKLIDFPVGTVCGLVFSKQTKRLWTFSIPSVHQTISNVYQKCVKRIC